MDTDRPTSYDPTEAGYAAGLTVRREVMGDSFVDRALARTDGTESAALQDYVTEHVWGGIWNRPGLDRRSRSLLNIGILTALRAETELAGHIRGAMNNGLSRAEITEAIVHTTGYCGAPAALAAMRIAQGVFDHIAETE
ncbi:carboxymuconolactone decarboxylase family protein [Nocardia asteroides]|uniref:carboxymuconolactone decarboxylase family protein n=1 Tax=Nocardia asteroides TaxID=1824 RepID=UPI0037A01873